VCDLTIRWSGRVVDKLPSSFTGLRAAQLKRQACGEIMSLRTLTLILTLLVQPAFGSDESIAKARAVFDRYSSLEAAFDPAVADLYSDAAVIQNKRIYPTGQSRVLTLPADRYKALIRFSMPIAKAKGDYSVYTDTALRPEGANVRVTATRFSVLKKYKSPISLLIGPTFSGDWLILEELSESQP
jgi:hypothetical protein